MVKKSACLHDILKEEGWVPYRTTVPSKTKACSNLLQKGFIPKIHTLQEERSLLSWILDIELPYTFAEGRYDNFRIVPSSIALEGHPVEFSKKTMKGHILYVHKNPKFEDDGLAVNVYVDRARGKTAYRL